MSRLSDLKCFYEVLAALERKVGGKRLLGECNGRMDWPERGVYFFFEPCETRSDSGEGLRVVRVGTHALKSGSRTSFWNRLSQHRGATSSGGGNHRGSIFRLLIGAAIKNRDRRQQPVSWGIGGDPSQPARQLGLSREEVLLTERNLEAEVSRYIWSLPFLSVEVNDAPGQSSDRGVIERNSVALLSNYKRTTLDPPSISWLGMHCNRERVRASGLWNNNHVDEKYDANFLSVLDRYAGRSLFGRAHTLPANKETK